MFLQCLIFVKLSLVHANQHHNQSNMGNSTYTLNISFTDDQLKLLYASGTHVVLAKPPAGSDPNIAWQTFMPLAANTVSWNEDYQLYASTEKVEHEVIIKMQATTDYPAAIGKLYTLKETKGFSGPGPGGSPGEFSMVNDYRPKPYMTMGMIQPATINGTESPDNPCSADPVILRSTITIPPGDTVYLWLQSNLRAKEIVGDITSPITKIKFGGDITSVSVAYDSNTGRFVVQ